ncbi:universal stress protein [Vibrio sp. WJH972]
MFKKILVPVDLNDKGFSDRAIELAILHAKSSGGKLYLLNVMPGVHMPLVSTYFPKEAAERMKEEVETKLREFAETHIGDEVKYSMRVDTGRPYTTILNYSEKVGADLIVIPSHKRSKVDRVVLGSVASKVVEHSPINVLVVKPKR